MFIFHFWDKFCTINVKFKKMEGKEISKYKIIKKIGLGGPISLYVAEEIENKDNKVVVKIFDKTLANDKDIISRFEKEIPKSVKLKHKNIVDVITHRRTDDYMAIFMEALKGQNLQFVVLIKGLSVRAIIEVFSYVLKAVDYAHKQNLVHSNLKPSNVFITNKNKNLKVLDFCIAQVLGLNNPQIVVNQNIESAMYMSPEMVKGERVDPRSDIYSMGVLLYFMISHKTPYLKTAPNKVLIDKIINEPVPLIKGYSVFNDIIQKATAKKKEDRYQSCGELLSVVEKL